MIQHRRFDSYPLHIKSGAPGRERIGKDETWASQVQHVRTVNGYLKWLEGRGVKYEVRRGPDGTFLVKGLTL